MYFFRRVNPFVQSVSGWAWIITTVLTAIYALIGFASPIFEGLHWTGIALLAILMTLGTLFAVAIIAAIGAWVYRQIKPVPPSEMAEELERTKQRLARAEERLDGAQVASAVGYASASGATEAKPKLAEAERERAAEGLGAAFDYLSGPLHDFWNRLAIGNRGYPADLIEAADMETLRQTVLDMGRAVRTRHSHFLDIVGVDVGTVIIELERINGPMAQAVAAKAWPPDAQLQAIRPLQQAFSDLSGSMDNLRQAIAEARQELG